MFKNTMRKGLLLLSSGIDSPVAGYLMMKKGVDIVAVYFDNQPLTNDTPLKKVKSLFAHLLKMFKKKIKLYVINHGVAQIELLKHCNRRYLCILCRRMMFRIAERIAKKEKCAFLVTGENLGQVCSQTLTNLSVADKAVKMTIVRPLLCNDKNETIKIAKEIGTYNISIEAATCCRAVPRHPATKAKIDVVEAEEEKVDIKKLVSEAVNGAKVILIKS